ncbi:hypothetical protein [Corynebacterium jeikeium]|uniref:hypothetical protein n=1 Tax=Corynebacterium jeikeium TaxID=38289 RepID=UPI000311A1B7|nr:hypothetical protein [Corynebacterium jeikeium]
MLESHGGDDTPVVPWRCWVLVGAGGCGSAGAKFRWVLSRWVRSRWRQVPPVVRLKLLMVLDMPGGDVDAGASGVWHFLKAA